MTTQQMDIFLRLSESLNFRKVAEELYTTQPTISRQLRLMEEEWGFPLFVRNNKEVRLTPEGVIMTEYVKKSLNLLAEGHQKVKMQKDGISGKIRIGIPESMDSGGTVMTAISDFSERYADVEINLKKCSFSELRERLSGDELDLVFTLEFDLKNYRGIVCDILDTAVSGFIAAKNYPVTKYHEITGKAFSGETFILPAETDSPGRKEDLYMIFDRLGISGEHIIYAPSTEAVMIKVRAGQGIACSDTSAAAVHDTESFRFYPFPEDLRNVSILYVWKKSNLNPVLALLSNFLIEYSL
ncbi:Cyn operon transcriptional activator [uncultured Roseburia sp.]|uniref:LysR family transcriptional regulator n=1 Tax=Brotonthovivens ammoniilytica TaxID=2981725 RepID=A0ABT2TK58_9FIRM|nr:LysR family transcriptional regulator [Brotonthovivens ammoniilytica]MCU6762608.1 LysR family transcriptional regulator [Brotonthovivens ammoniilytica]SCI77227.1 Cyn operon transcriptional activator [uncultured Roseburia sp.]